MQHASWTEKDQQLHLALLPSRVVTRHPSSPSSLFPQKKAFSLFVSELLAHTKGVVEAVLDGYSFRSTMFITQGDDATYNPYPSTINNARYQTAIPLLKDDGPPRVKLSI
ncbi:hypothetical protein HL42_0955 [Trichophyton rubrum]|nr:hypothetical protein HL42_0955 [Trichophyton rubrum]